VPVSIVTVYFKFSKYSDEHKSTGERFRHTIKLKILFLLVMFPSSAYAFGKIRERERFFAGEKVVAKFGPTGAFSIAIVLEVMGEGND
jgi:hypothetical protein